MQALEEHEHEGGGEEEVDEDGDDPAGPRVVVERRQQEADVRHDQADLHVELNHSVENARRGFTPMGTFSISISGGNRSPANFFNIERGPSNIPHHRKKHE